jgi:hypothetical protein
MTYPNNPLFNSVSVALNHFQSIPVLDISVDCLSDIVEHHRYTGHPDEECNYESDMRGDLECLLDTVMMVQERCAELTDIMMESAEWEARHLQAHAEYHELFEKYGSKSK